MRHLSMLVSTAMLAALTAICLLSDPLAAQQPPPPSRDPSMARPTGEAPGCTLRQDMRKLWTDHVVWTRDYIIAAVDDKPDQEAAAKRLLKNQEDIGRAVGAFYGSQAGDALTKLLKEHITIAVDLIKASKTGDNAKVTEVNGTWQRNANDIAEFLSKANPNWPKATLAEMMQMHLTTTTAEVKARLDKNWDADVKAYDEVYEHILKMSDALTDGIVKQFPDRF